MAAATVKLEFKILTEVRKTNSTVYSARPSTYSYDTALRRAHFSLFRDLLGRFSRKMTTEGERKACESWLIFKDNLLKAQDHSFTQEFKQA